MFELCLVLLGQSVCPSHSREEIVDLEKICSASYAEEAKSLLGRHKSDDVHFAES